MNHALKTGRPLSSIWFYSIIFISACLLYLPFINNPLVFDDLYFFSSGNPAKYVNEAFQLQPRWWVYYTLGLTFTKVGPEVIWFRMGNLVLHAMTGMVLYALTHRLLRDLTSPKPGHLSIQWLALLTSLMFVLHPVAVYGAGYLIQRTTVLATLFSLMTWLSFWKGIQGSRLWIWLSPLFYFVAVFSKEHAVMAPAVCLALLLLHHRSAIRSIQYSSEIWIAYSIQVIITVYVILLSKGFIGNVYEPLVNAQLMAGSGGLSAQGGLAWPLSILTQSSLFFKYLYFWLIPDITNMSVDMREAFSSSVTFWNLLGLIAFVVYPLVAIWLLWKGRNTGLLGLAMISPWLLFATELSTVRFQEIFVLYRSYLWITLSFVGISLGLALISRRTAMSVVAVLILALYGLSYDRLTSFSHGYLLWNEAAKLAEKNVKNANISGLERIYYNRGITLAQEGLIDNAIQDYDRAIAVKPDFTPAYIARGSANLTAKRHEHALSDFITAIQHAPNDVQAIYGYGLALHRLGRDPEALKQYQSACIRGWVPACERYVKTTKQ